MAETAGYWVVAIATVAGIAGSTAGLAGESGKAAPNAAAAAAPSQPLYFMTSDEMKFDCRRLTGHLQVRIRQYRSTVADKKTSDVARGLQQAVTPVFGGTQRGIDQDADNARDLSMLKVYNGRLAALNCATFDLDRLLAPGNDEAPRPTPKVKPAGGAPVIFKAAKPKPAAVPAIAPSGKQP